VSKMRRGNVRGGECPGGTGVCPPPVNRKMALLLLSVVARSGSLRHSMTSSLSSSPLSSVGHAAALQYVSTARVLAPDQDRG